MISQRELIDVKHPVLVFLHKLNSHRTALRSIRTPLPPLPYNDIASRPYCSSAPWRPLLDSHIESHINSKHASTSSDSNSTSARASFTLATVSPSGHPKVRMVDHRGFWFRDETDCPTFITAASSSKVSDIVDSSSAIDREGGD